MTISPKERRDLEAALRSAFPTRAKLEQMVRHRLDVSLNEIVAEGDLKATVFDLVGWAEANGKLSGLIDAACKENPGNPALRALLSKVRVAPTPASVPRVLPPRRLFVGRERELDAVGRALERSGQGTITQASVWGLGGVGKTALALEHAYRVLDSGECPAGVWWLMAEGEPLAVMTRLADLLRKHAPDMMAHIPLDASPEDVVEGMRLALEAHPEPILLVLDNVDRDLRRYLPSGKVKVLLTTRDANVSLGSAIALDVLSHEDAKALAVKIAGAPRNEQEAAAFERVVVHRLGALAVAVEVASNAVHRWVKGWVAYEKHLIQSIAVVDREKHRSVDYPAGVFAALDMSMGRAGPIARRLLEGAAAFAPDAVPLGWAYGVAALDQEDIEAQEACGELEGLGIFKVDREQSRVSMHRLVHLRTQQQANPEAWRRLTGRVVESVRAWLIKTVGETRAQMEAVESQRAHVDEALRWAKEQNEHVAWSAIANELACHLWHRADYLQARAFFEQALALAEEAFGPDHPNVAIRLSNLAGVHQDLGEPDKARLLIERALGIYEKTFGPDHPDVAIRLSNLATVHKDFGEPDKARPLLERAVGIATKRLGPDHPSTVKIRNYLARLLNELDRG